MEIAPQSLSQIPQNLKRAKGNINITWASSSAPISSLPWPERSFISCYWLLVTAAGWLMFVFFYSSSAPIFLLQAHFRCLFETLGHWGIITSREKRRKSCEVDNKEAVLPVEQLHLRKTLFFPCLPTISSMHLCIVATNVLTQSDDRPSGLHRAGRYGTVLLLLLLNEELCEKEEVELWQEGLRSRMLTFYLLRRDSWGHGG